MLGVERLDAFLAFVAERHAIYIRKARTNGLELPDWAAPADPPPLSGQTLFAASEPLTEDPILARFRFCNVFRELDRVTIWIRRCIREPYADHPLLWYMIAIARWINWPPTLGELIARGAWPDRPDFEPTWLTEVLEDRRDRGEKVETGAYVIRAESGDPRKPWAEWTKQRYVAEVVLGRPWEARHEVEAVVETLDTLERATRTFAAFYGWGGFMAYEVASDLAFTRYLAPAPLDEYFWGHAGPGAKRGLNRLLGHDPRAALPQREALELMRLVLALANRGRAVWVPELKMREVEHSLCEFDKYERVRLGEGRPRSRYVPGRGW